VSFRSFRLPACSTPDFVAEGQSGRARADWKQQYLKAQSFGNSFEKTRTQRSPAVVEKDGQAETHQATARQGQERKTSPEVSKKAGCFAQAFRFEEEWIARPAFCQSIEWR
jgi:hypothetical protein